MLHLPIFSVTCRPRISILFVFFAVFSAPWFTTAGQTIGPSKSKSLSEAQAELQRRVSEARAVGSSGDSYRSKKASEQVIALALREIAQLRLLESAYSQSAELYLRSLDFEDDPDTRVDLAIAEIGRFNTDAAIAQLDQVLARHPDDIRALTAAGRAWTLKKNYGRAAEYLGRVAALSPDVDSLYSWAACLLASKDEKQQAKADEVFAQMIKMAGDSGSLHVMFGRAYRDSGEMPAAVREFQKAIAIDTQTPHAHYFLGLARLSMNEWAPTPEARIEFIAELRHFPRDYLANYMLGYVDSVEHRYVESNQRLKLAAQIDATTPEPWLYLGLNSNALGDQKAAESNLRKAIDLTGENESRAVYQVRRAYITLGRILISSGRTEEGENLLIKGRELQNKVLELSQQQIGAHLLEGGVGAAAVVLPLASEEEQYNAPLLAAPVDIFGKIDEATLGRSRLTADQQRQAQSEEQSLRSVLGFGFAQLGAAEAMANIYRSALTHFQEAERWDARVPGLYRNLGVAAYRANDYPEAIRALNLALAEKSIDPPLRAMLGMTYFASDRYNDAVNAFSPLGETGMRDPLAGYAWAASLARLGDLKRAGAVLAAMETNDLPLETSLLVGQLWITIEDYSRAIASIDKALSANPRLLRAHYFKGMAYLLSSHHPQAAEEFQAELSLNPDDPEAKDNLGFIYMEESRADDAIALFQSVLATHPDDATAHYQLGKILLDKGKIEEAISHLEFAARQSPDTDYIHYQLQAAYRKAVRSVDAERELQIYKELKARKRGSTTLPAISENP